MYFLGETPPNHVYAYITLVLSGDETLQFYLKKDYSSSRILAFAVNNSFLDNVRMKFENERNDVGMIDQLYESCWLKVATIN